jgi:DNA recombination protein Rad52
MPFANAQLRKLKAKIKPYHIKSREADGITLHYLEGWHVIAEANRIFGFDGWDRETVASQCVWTKQLGSRFAAAYVIRVKISVRAGETTITREGSGAGEATAATSGEAHELAAKAAETDATKRALSTFGNAFGLSLYGGSPSASEPVERPRDAAGRFSRPYQRISEKEQETPPTSTTSIDKSQLARSEPKRQRDTNHLRFISGKTCLICGRLPSHPHHLTFTQPRALGRKVSDEFAVPLCNLHHRELHERGDERAWWIAKNINPLPFARELWAESRGWLLRDRGANAPAPETEPQRAPGE